MTNEELHGVVVQHAENLQIMYDAICMGLPEDEEGFAQVKGDLGDALKSMANTISFLSRLAFRIGNPDL